MKFNNYEIQGYFSSAKMTADFSVIQCILQDDRQWAANVLERSAYDPKLCKKVGMINRVFPSRIFPCSPDNFIALGPIGVTKRLVYQIDRISCESIQITPIPHIESVCKFGTIIFLASLFFIPALLTPIVWQSTNSRNYNLSRFSLKGFCEYLVESQSY